MSFSGQFDQRNHKLPAKLCVSGVDGRFFLTITKKLVVTSATLLVTSALLVVTKKLVEYIGPGKVHNSLCWCSDMVEFTHSIIARLT